MAAREPARIVNRGMGGFLNPPTHPEHSMSVETDLRRRPENRGSMSLRAAAECSWIDEGTRARAAEILDTWKAPSLDRDDVKAWVRGVLGYFAGCYQNPDAPQGETWHASRLICDRTRDPMAYVLEHAGVNHIRRFYPGYQPTREDFASAKWGE